MNRRRVLFVDDEQRILQGLQRTLRGMRKEWDMSFAGSASEALDLMAKDPYDAVVADMRMPGMDGAQLLNEVKDRYPKSVRIILSGHADREMIMRSLGATHQYLAKPCDAENLKATLGRALALNSLLQGDPLFEPLIARIQSLPSLPSLYLKIQDELSSPDPSIARVADVIIQDPAMTAKILQIVNSAFFSLRRRVADIDQAVTLLGIDTIVALVLNVHLFRSAAGAGPASDIVEQIRIRSLKVAQLARVIAKSEGLPPAQAEEAYLAGVLYGSGKLVFATNWPEQFVALADAPDAFAAERGAFGADHAAVGAYLLALWGLPDSIVEAVAYHHRPSAGPGRSVSPLTAVHAAHVLETSASSGEEPKFDEAYLAAGDFVDRVPKWLAVAEDVAYERENRE